MENFIVVVFDGECGVCHRLVQFLLARRSRRHFRFLTLKKFLTSRPSSYDVRGRPIDGRSLIVLSGDTWLQQSDAILAIGMALGWPWRLGGVFRIVPRFIRDALYDTFARNRHRFEVAKAHSCTVPDSGDRDLFLEAIPESKAALSQEEEAPT